MPMATKEAQRKYQREWVAKRRAAYLAGKSCARCASTERLEVDHIDRETKVSHAVWSWREDRRLAELAKCQVLCHECHMEKTADENATATHGSSTRLYRTGCRCRPCKDAHAAYARLYRDQQWGKRLAA